MDVSDDDSSIEWEAVDAAAADAGASAATAALAEDAGRPRAPPDAVNSSTSLTLDLSAKDIAAAKLAAVRRRGISAADRAARRILHKAHVAALVAAARIRAQWASSPDLVAACDAALPSHFHGIFNTTMPQRFNFVAALRDLLRWFSHAHGIDHAAAVRERVCLQGSSGTLPSAGSSSGTNTSSDSAAAAIASAGSAIGIGDRILAAARAVPPCDGRSYSALLQDVLQHAGSHEELIENALIWATARRGDETCPSSVDEFVVLVKLLASAPASAANLGIAFAHPGAACEVLHVLFAAFCRAAGLRTRLVCSLKPIPLSFAQEYALSETAPSAGAVTSQQEPFPQNQQQRAATSSPPLAERQARSVTPQRNTSRRRRRTTSTSSPAFSPSTSRSDIAIEVIIPPVQIPYPLKYWVEVYDLMRKEWICVDATTLSVDKPGTMDLLDSIKSPAQARLSPWWGRPLSYAVAYEGSHSAVDVTKRYSTNWARTNKHRVHDMKSNPLFSSDSSWIERSVLRRLQPSNASDREAERRSLQNSVALERMPTTISGLKDHPVFVLPRFLKKSEALRPEAKHVGIVRGEKVYKRNDVSQVMRKEAWLRKHGKEPKPEEINLPYKIVDAQIRTKLKKREIAATKAIRNPALYKGGGTLGDSDESGDDSASISTSVSTAESLVNSLDVGEKVGLYAEWQVRDYVPPVIADGVIPVSPYGNFDLLHPCMLPAGCAHLDMPGIAKTAKLLGIRHAPTVVDFEYRRGGAYPVVSGIICLETDKDLLLEAHVAHATHTFMEESKKRQERALKNWQHIIARAFKKERIMRGLLHSSAGSISNRADDNAEKRRDRLLTRVLEASRQDDSSDDDGCDDTTNLQGETAPKDFVNKGKGRAHKRVRSKEHRNGSSERSKDKVLKRRRIHKQLDASSDDEHDDALDDDDIEIVEQGQKVLAEEAAGATRRARRSRAAAQKPGMYSEVLSSGEENEDADDAEAPMASAPFNTDSAQSTEVNNPEVNGDDDTGYLQDLELEGYSRLRRQRRGHVLANASEGSGTIDDETLNTVDYIDDEEHMAGGFLRDDDAEEGLDHDENDDVEGGGFLAEGEQDEASRDDLLDLELDV